MFIELIEVVLVIMIVFVIIFYILGRGCWQKQNWECPH